jgi:crossover junction endodeoxyribonuclease RuvC
MFVLGIDPGLSRCGFGLVEGFAANQTSSRRTGIGRSRTTVSAPHVCVEFGVLSTSPDDPIHVRLASMLDQLDELMTRLSPQVVVVERVFFQTNARTAMGVGQASGLALALATKRGAQVHQYTSNEVKQAVAGYGAAEKWQMQTMVASLLGLDAPPKPADAADALGLALCHLAYAPATRAAIGAASVGRPISDSGSGQFGGRPLRVAASVGGVALAPTTPRSAETHRRVSP